MYNLYCETLKIADSQLKNKYWQKWPYFEQIDQLVSVEGYIAPYNQKGWSFEPGVMRKLLREFVSWSIIMWTSVIHN